MIYLNCYLLKTDIVDLSGESVGDLPQYLMQVEKRIDSKTNSTEIKFVYINDTLEDIKLEDYIIQSLREEKIIKEKLSYLIDVNNNSMVIEFNKGNYYVVE